MLYALGKVIFQPKITVGESSEEARNEETSFAFGDGDHRSTAAVDEPS